MMANRAEECLRKAEQCEHAATVATDPEAQRTYRHLAQQWRELATHFEAKEQRIAAQRAGAMNGVGEPSDWLGFDFKEASAQRRYATHACQGIYATLEIFRTGRVLSSVPKQRLSTEPPQRAYEVVGWTLRLRNSRTTSSG
jgi:hypothetical protein